MINTEKVRKDTKGCTNKIHFNNAGASLMPSPVSKSIVNYILEEEKLGGYETAKLYNNQLEDFYDSFAKLLNCNRDEIAFCENATRAWDMAFYSFKFKKGDKILTSVEDYGSNIISYLQQAKKTGVQLVFVPNNKEGQIDTEQLENLIDENVKLISISHIPTGNGLVNPANLIGKIANKYKIPYLLDACQSVGQIPVNVKKIGCDILSGTGRKYLRGPRGTGFLYVKSSLIAKMEPPLLDLHAAQLLSSNKYIISNDCKRFENWEQNFAGKIGLKTAVDYAMEIGLSNIKKRVYFLADNLRKQLNKYNQIILTDTGTEKCGIVTFTSKRLTATEIKDKLSVYNINVSVSKGSGNLISFIERNLKEVVRASVHYFNNENEIDKFIEVLKIIHN